MTPFYLLLLPALVYANIAVYIDLRTDSPLVDVTGHSWVPIPEKERASFKLDEEQLKISVANYSKAVPTDVFVRNGKFDLYKTYGWQEVRRSIRPTLETKTMDDNKMSSECNPVEAEALKNNLTFSGVWSNYTVPTSEGIKYTLIFNDTHNLTINSSWGKAIHEHQTTFPETKLTVSKCIVHLYLEFEGALSGDVAVNYLAKRQGSHFWKYDVNYVLNAVNWPVSLLHQENVTIEYYK